ncbi:dihydrolipoamide acetyltransferase family protein [Salinisphaera sp. RV14]|uniref:dihydrolipoamide acetyltransferase family protein n=1 Tax=unclassified Salinisphaera TaxID=2649847 RepID=UPI003F859C28
MAVLVEVPHIGMDLAEVTVVEWLVAEGDHVAKGDPILTIETDKTNHDLEAEVAGIIRRLRGKAGDVIAVGEPLAWIVSEDEPAPALPDVAADKAEPPVSVEAPVSVDSDSRVEPMGDSDAADREPAPESAAAGVGAGRGLASPAARREAAAQGLDIRDVAGSGPDGVVYQADVRAAAGRPGDMPVRERASDESAAGEIVALSRVQQLTGERTQRSFRDIPHFYLERELEIDALLDLRTELAARIEHKPSLGCLLCFAIARTLTEHPRLNGRLIGTDRLELRRQVHLGVAVAGKDGLVVPVIRDAGRIAFKTFAERYRGLTRRAVARELAGDEMTGGTFTVSNLGMFGIDRFNAIINAPQSAIIAIGRRRTVPAWANGEWKPKTVVSATLSVDHRAADGVDGARFLADLAERSRHWSLLL